MQGIKLTFFPGSHLAPKYFKVVANSKKLVAMTHTHKTIFTLSLNLRSGVPLLFVGAGKERLIQLLDYSSVASPQSGLFSDWSRNKRVLRTKP